MVSPVKHTGRASCVAHSSGRDGLVVHRQSWLPPALCLALRLHSIRIKFCLDMSYFKLQYHRLVDMYPRFQYIFSLFRERQH